MVSCFRPADAVRDGGASVMVQTLPSEVMIFMVPCGPASLTPSVTVPVMAVTSSTFPPPTWGAKGGMGGGKEKGGGGTDWVMGQANSLDGPAGFYPQPWVLRVKI